MSTRPSSRIVAIDAGRLVATCGIVWVHVSEVQGLEPRLAALGRFGTSFYIVAAVLMSALPFFRSQGRSPKEVVRIRARRLLIPFALWSVIYAAFYLGTMLPQGYRLSQIVLLWGPLAGTAPHLWFLPFAFLASAVTAISMPYLLGLPERTLILGLGLCVICTYSVSYGVLLPKLDHGALARMSLVRLGRYIEEAPLALSAILGVAWYGKARRRLGRLGRERRRRLANYFLLSFAVFELAYFFALESLRQLFWTEVRAFANVLGSVWLGVCLALRRNAVILWLARYGRATYFAFLVHQLLLDVVKVPLSQVAKQGSIAVALATTLGIFSLSLVLGLWVPKVRGLRLLVP